MSRRLKTWLLVGVLATMINLPLLHSTLQARDLDRNGIRSTVPAQTLEEAQTADGGAALEEAVRDAESGLVERLVVVRLPAEVVEAVVGQQVEEGAPAAQDDRVLVPFEEAAYDAVVASGETEVVHKSDNPKVYRVTGRVGSSAALITTLVANAILVALVGFFVAVRSRLRPELRLLATEDLVRAAPGGVLERLEGTSYRVCGDVAVIEQDELVLEVGDRRVRVHLDGHHNPAGYQQSVEVRGTMVG